MAKIIWNESEANGEAFLTFIVGATMNAPEGIPETTGHLSVYELPDQKRCLYTDFNQDVYEAMKQTQCMAERHAIKYILVREFGQRLPAELWN